VKCVAPVEIKQGDLMEVLQGTAPPQVADHVARCPACAAQVAALAQADRVLRASLFRASCPAADDLLCYASGTLPPGERRQVAQHLGLCPHCAADVRELEQAGVAAESGWRQQVARTARALIEALAVPPRLDLAPARRGVPGQPRLYRAGELDIALGGEAAGSAFRVHGRVMQRGAPAPHFAGCTARLVRHDVVIAHQRVSELGHFSFEDLPPGVYDLVLEQPDADIVIRRISLENYASGAEHDRR